jgi:putative aminopeptidase FrvX
MYVKRNGGSDHMIAPSKRVNIHTKKGFVSAVFGWPAIHTRGGANAKLAPTVHNITLDCGATSKQEVLDMGIHVGSVITYKDEFFVLNDKYAGGKSLDNKAGGVVIALVTKMLSDKKVKLPFGLYIVNAVQEEVGLRGAQMITETIKPNVAIVTDVAHDTNTPLIDKKIEGDFNCGDGPILTYGPAVHNKLLDIIIDAAEDNKISFQRDAASRATGTDTDAFAYSNGGVPSALISFPMRYMHTTVEMVALTDVEDTVKLIFETLKKLTPETNFKYL